MDHASSGTASRSDLAAPPTAALDEVDILSELAVRPRRLPNYAQECRALNALAAEMAERPRNVLQKLVEIAVDLCEADTAGVSLLDGDVFRWEAVAGVFAGARGGTMPRAESPCGVCIDRDATQLMYLADRCFPALAAEPRFVEALLIPFHDRGRPIGTVWVVTHSADRKFDSEDERVVSVLATFAAAGWQLWTASEAATDGSRRLHGGAGTVTSAGPNRGSGFTAHFPVHPTPGPMATAVLRSGSRGPLFWSKRGDVACAAHAPDAQSARWQAEGWAPIPDLPNRRSCQCPVCAHDGRRRSHS